MVSGSLRPRGLPLTRHLCPWNLQARTLEWVPMPSSRGSSWPRDQTQSLTSPAFAGRFCTTSAVHQFTNIINLLTYHWEAPYDTELSLLDIYPQEIKICLRKHFYMNVYTSIIYNSQKLETTQVLISEWKNKFGTYVPWDTTQHRNKYTVFICINTLNNIDECPKH